MKEKASPIMEREWETVLFVRWDGSAETYALFIGCYWSAKIIGRAGVHG